MKRTLRKTNRLVATMRMIHQGYTLEDIAFNLMLTLGTTVKYIEILILEGEDVSIEKYMEISKINIIVSAFSELGIERLKPVKEKLGDEFSYNEIRLVRAKYFRSCMWDCNNGLR